MERRGGGWEVSVKCARRRGTLFDLVEQHTHHVIHIADVTNTPICCPTITDDGLADRQRVRFVAPNDEHRMRL